MAEVTPNGHKTEELAERISPFVELGVAGYKVFGGQISHEFLLELQGVRGRRTYHEMASNDPVLAGVLFAIESAFRDRDPIVIPGGTTTADKEAATFLETCVHDMSLSWQSFMSDVVTMFTHGWGWFEIVYKRRNGSTAASESDYDDGRIGWRKFAFRDQLTLQRWELDEHQGVRGMWQQPPNFGTPVFLPIEKSLHFTTKHAGGNPEGYSVLRGAYLPWYYRKNLQAIEAISLERIGAGIPTVHLPEGYTEADLTKANSTIQRFKVDEQMGFTLPPGWELELAFGGAGSRGIADGFEQAIVRYRQEMLLSTLSQFLVLGMDKVGSFALSKTARDFFQVALGGWLRHIEQVINKYAVARLFHLNDFAGITAFPTLSLGTIGDSDIQMLIDGLAKLVPQGVITPDSAIEGRVREILDLPERVEGQEPPRPAPVIGTDDIEGGGAANTAARPFWTNYP